MDTNVVTQIPATPPAQPRAARVRKVTGPFLMGEVEDIAAVPVPPKTPADHIAARLDGLAVGQTFPVSGVSLALVRRVAKAWVERQKPEAGVKARVEQDGTRVRVWRTA